MHEQVREGDELAARPPRNNFPLARNASHHMLLAGGIGVTPMMAMMRELARRDESFEMHYCTRSPARTAFRDEIASSVFADRVRFHHDGGDPARGLDIAGLLRKARKGAHVYSCGPAGFMRACEAASRHWPQGSVHFEYFSADETVEHGASEAFQVKIASSGAILDVPADKSIVRCCAPTASRSTPCARKASAAPAPPCCWRARRTTAISCSTTRRGPGASSSWSAAAGPDRPC